MVGLLGKAMVSAALAVLLGACALTPERNAVPEALVEVATVPVGADIRIWGDAPPADVDALVERYVAQRKASLARGDVSREVNMLAISGGGSNGAHGAGFLVGWTQAGTRPQFDLVTGVSTGAMAAPFAFLGPDYDSQLRDIYTNITDGDIYRERPLLAGLAGTSFTSSHPLRSMIERYVTDDLLIAIAREHAKGRRLAIGTTNLDAQRPVYWNMGAIAELGGPRARQLFVDVLLASASIPGVLPPVHIDVEVDGARYDEMHVDGGTTREVFVMPEMLVLNNIERRLGRPSKRRLFIIRNGKTSPEWEAVEPNTLDIAGRALSTIIKSQAGGDLYRLHEFARKNGIEYNHASIRESFDVTAKSEFDQAYMRALFELGVQEAAAGYRWSKSPLGS